jgi:5-formyltetrahydrofolate cyclo-ligase
VADGAVAIQDRKQALRSSILAQRSVMSDVDRETAAVMLAAHCRVRWTTLTTVATYLTMTTEPPTGPLVDHFVHHGITVLVPIVDGENLDWAPYDGTRKVVAGPLGFREPIGSRLGAAAITSADLVLVPTLAVDRHGNRLGRGRGYYDRVLAEITAPIVAVVYDHEFVAEVPSEAHDRRVDGVLRPAGFVSVGRS